MKIIRVFAIMFFLTLVYITIAADTGQLPKVIADVYTFEYGDKISHFVLMGIFAFLVNFSLRNQMVKIYSFNWLLGSLIVLALASFEEISQAFYPTRTASIFDLTSSILGILIIGSLSVLFPIQTKTSS